MQQNKTKKNLDRSMRQPISGHCTSRESSHHCPHHLSTYILELLSYLRWATMGSQRIYCISDLLNRVQKVRIKIWSTPVCFPYNSNRSKNKFLEFNLVGIYKEFHPNYYVKRLKFVSSKSTNMYLWYAYSIFLLQYEIFGLLALFYIF